MEQQGNTIRVSYTNPEINSKLAQAKGSPIELDMHFNQNEEFFFRLTEEILIPSFPIHHDINNPQPSDYYLKQLGSVIDQVIEKLPHAFSGLTYGFDPGDTLRPFFFKLYRVGQSLYLYLVRLDMFFRPQEHRIAEKGTNDTTHSFWTRQIYLDATIIPIHSVETEDNRIKGFNILQTISQTWIGESGRGYFVQGIWIDHELTKFFSKLVLVRGKRFYPFYPIQCRYKTVCLFVMNMAPDARVAQLPLLHRTIQFLEPVMGSIQTAMKDIVFTENIPIFQNLKAKIPPDWEKIWESVTIEVYLNESDFKEFSVKL